MKVLALSVLVMAICVDAGRILAFFPLASKSHHFVFRPILAALAKRGHQVVYYTAFPYEGDPPSGIHQVDLSPHLPSLHGSINIMDLVDQTLFTTIKTTHNFGLLMSPKFLSNPPVQELIHSNQKFDAVLMSSYIIQECMSAFVHKFGAVGIDIVPLGDSSWVNELSGLPNNPSYQLDMRAETNQNMNFWQRLYNTYMLAMTIAFGYYHLYIHQNIMDQYFNYTGWETRPPLRQLISNRSLILTNSHFAIGYPAPLSSNKIEIGGVHIAETNKPLPQDIQAWMDGGKGGVIYFSLGSNINVSDPVNENIRKAFVKVFEEVPQRVLMKWEAEYTGRLPNNVKLGKWFPQQDVLAHKNCVLFITHGGYLSLTEAVHFGVPVIGIPFFGDQPKNFYFAEDAGIGRMLRLGDINYHNVSKIVKEVLSNSSYKTEIMKRSRILQDRPQSPVDKAVYWIEHAIKYPNALTPKAASLSFVQLHLIDLQLFILTVILIIAFLVRKFYMLLSWKLSPKSINKKVKTN